MARLRKGKVGSARQTVEETGRHFLLSLMGDEDPNSGLVGVIEVGGLRIEELSGGGFVVSFEGSGEILLESALDDVGLESQRPRGDVVEKLAELFGGHPIGKDPLLKAGDFRCLFFGGDLIHDFDDLGSAPLFTFGQFGKILSLGKALASFRVVGSRGPVELADPALNLPLLKARADLSGEEVVAPEELTQLPELVLLFALLTSEWILRRWAGLP